MGDTVDGQPFELPFVEFTEEAFHDIGPGGPGGDEVEVEPRGPTTTSFSTARLILAVTDSAILGTHADGLALVLRSGEADQRAAERAVDQLRRVGVRVFGAVLNEVPPSTVEESYHMQYYYSYH